MHLSRAKSISAQTDRALNRIRGARRSQALTLSGEKMGFEGTLEGFKRRGEPGKEWQRVPNPRSSSSECSGANASSDMWLCQELLSMWAQCTRGQVRLYQACQIGRRAVLQKLMKANWSLTYKEINYNTIFCIVKIIITIYFKNIHFFHAQLGSDVFPDMRLLHISLNTTHSECKPSSSIYPSHILSKSSCPYQHISPLPPPHSYRQTPNRLHSYAPHAQTTSIYHAIPPQPHSQPPKDYKSILRFLSFSDTPHIHLTTIRSVLSRLCRFATFIAQVSVPYVNTLWTQALYIFPFVRYDAPRAVRIGDNSLNLAQAHLALALAASSAPPPAPSVSPK